MRIVRRAWWYAAPAFLLALPAMFVTPAVAGALLVTAVGILAFYRDPARTPPPEGVLSPADGRVSVIRKEEDRIRVGVFMGVQNVHVNRTPVTGTVVNVEHRPGAHRPAFTKDSDRNERVEIELEADGATYEVSLIAGAFARRIRTYVDAGETLERGQRIGHIAFGSRADVLLPPGISRTELTVTNGERVRAGESVIATDVSP